MTDCNYDVQPLLKYKRQNCRTLRSQILKQASKKVLIT